MKMGYFCPQIQYSNKLTHGDIAFVVTQNKDPSNIIIGDTWCNNIKDQQLISFPKKPKQLVWCVLFSYEYTINKIKETLHRYSLNDTAFVFTQQDSDVLGAAFQCGFLGHFTFRNCYRTT